MESTVPGLVFGGEMSAEEYRAVFNDKTDWQSMTTDQKIEYRAKLRKVQLAGAVRLISIDADIENDLKAVSNEEKKRLREKDASFKSAARKNQTEKITVSEAEQTAASALGISITEFREKYAPKKPATLCPTHNVEMKVVKDGVTCEVCDALELVALALAKSAASAK